MRKFYIVEVIEEINIKDKMPEHGLFWFFFGWWLVPILILFKYLFLFMFYALYYPFIFPFVLLITGIRDGNVIKIVLGSLWSLFSAFGIILYISFILIPSIN